MKFTNIRQLMEWKELEVFFHATPKFWGVIYWRKSLCLLLRISAWVLNIDFLYLLRVITGMVNQISYRSKRLKRTLKHRKLWYFCLKSVLDNFGIQRRLSLLAHSYQINVPYWIIFYWATRNITRQLLKLLYSLTPL